MTDGYTGEDMLLSSHFLVSDCVGLRTYRAPFSTPAGARNWVFADCIAIDVFPSVSVVAGFEIRGQDMRVVNPVVVRCPTGILCAYGANVHIEGGEIRNCTDAFNLAKHPNVKVTGTAVVNPQRSVLRLQSSPSTAGYNFRLVTVEGNPANSVIVTAGTVDPSWVFDISAPQATTYQTGTTIPAGQIIKYVTANRF